MLFKKSCSLEVSNGFENMSSRHPPARGGARKKPAPNASFSKESGFSFGRGREFSFTTHAFGCCITWVSLFSGLSLSGVDMRKSIKESLQLAAASQTANGGLTGLAGRNGGAGLL